MSHIIYFDPSGTVVKIEKGATLSIAAKEAGIPLANLCNENGKCGRCRVMVSSGSVSNPGAEETNILGESNLKKGIRLACLAVPQSDVHVVVPQSSLVTEQRLLLDGKQLEIEAEPPVKRFSIDLGFFEKPEPFRIFKELANRLEAVYGIKVRKPGRNLPTRLISLASRYQGAVHAYVRGDSILDVVEENRSFPPLGLAVDLGTSKIAIFLIDLESGVTLSTRGFINPQVVYGEDIISRLRYAIKGDSKPLQDMVRVGINKNLSDMLDEVEKSPEEIFEYVLVGNTAMHHLFLNLPVENLAMSPYAPSPRPPMEIEIQEMNLNAHPAGILLCPPPIAGFVGSDHLSADLAVRLMEEESITVVIDIGTNTEVSCKAGGRIYCCSCASGPAFEGAGLSCGMRAAPGAIEWVDIDPDTGGISFATIGCLPPAGICGSGILDAVSSMLDAGIINHRGTFNKKYRGLVAIGDEPALKLCGTGADNLIAITQSDIREIQKAKGAMRAGIDALLQYAGIGYEAVARFIIAGAFGSFLDPRSALDIGMIPPVDQGIIEQVGNAAGVGAREILCSVAKRKEAFQLYRDIDHVDLISYPSFENLFASSMLLGEDAIQDYRATLQK